MKRTFTEQELLDKTIEAVEKAKAANAINKMAIRGSIEGATQAIYTSSDNVVSVSISSVPSSSHHDYFPPEWTGSRTRNLVNVMVLQLPDSTSNCRLIYYAIVSPIEPWIIVIPRPTTDTTISVDISYLQKDFDVDYRTYHTLFNYIQNWLAERRTSMYSMAYGISYSNSAEDGWRDISRYIRVDPNGSGISMSWINEYIRLTFLANIYSYTRRQSVVEHIDNMHRAIKYPEVALKLLVDKGVTSRRLLGRDDKFVLRNYVDRIKDILINDVNRVVSDHVMWAGSRICVKHHYNNIVNYALFSGEVMRNHDYNDPVVQYKASDLISVLDDAEIYCLLHTIHEYNYIEHEKHSEVLKEERDRIRTGGDFEI